MTTTQTATAARDAAFATYRNLVDEVAAATTTRKRNATQKRCDAAYADYRFACADVERAVRATMPGAPEAVVMAAAAAA